MRSDHLSKHLKTHQARRNQAQSQQQVQTQQNLSQVVSEENALIIAQTEIGMDSESSDTKADIVNREMVGQISV